MSVELIFQQDRLALGAVLVLTHVLTLLHQMVFNLLDLDDLVALPTKSQHGAFLPVMHVQSLLVKVWVVSTTKSAGIIFHLFFHLLLLVVLRLWFVSLSLSGLLFLWLCRLLASLRLADVGLNHLFLLLGRHLLLLSGRGSRLLVLLCKLLLQSLQLGWVQGVVVLRKVVATHNLVELDHAFISRVPDIGVGVLNTFDCKFGGILLLVG